MCFPPHSHQVKVQLCQLHCCQCSSLRQVSPHHRRPLSPCHPSRSSLSNWCRTHRSHTSHIALSCLPFGSLRLNYSVSLQLCILLHALDGPLHAVICVWSSGDFFVPDSCVPISFSASSYSLVSLLFSALSDTISSPASSCSARSAWSSRSR